MRKVYLKAIAIVINEQKIAWAIKDMKFYARKRRTAQFILSRLSKG